DKEELTQQMADYDTLVQHYNRTRAGGTNDNDWCAHIIDYYRHAMDYRILDYLRAQGYDIKH
ncbi:MAG: NADPH-dependent oxidoreductase, partial [Muribaculaceae bacterium]|nr:NADPH-dependent oxidoreductase [Muribaculaceae bacterium]